MLSRYMVRHLGTLCISSTGKRIAMLQVQLELLGRMGVQFFSSQLVSVETEDCYRRG